MKFKSIATAAAAALLCPVVAWASQISITPSSQGPVAFGSAVTVKVGVSGLTADSQILSTFNLNVLYTLGLLNTGPVTGFLAQSQFGGAALAHFDTLATVGFPATADGSTWAAGYSDLVLDSDYQAVQGDSFDLFTLTFIAGNTAGDVFLNFGLDPDYQRGQTGTDGVAIPGMQFTGACIAVGSGAGSSCVNASGNVPEPASYGLAGVALLAAGVAGRTRRRSGAATAAA